MCTGKTGGRKKSAGFFTSFTLYRTKYTRKIFRSFFVVLSYHRI